jgi:hypothetical protein
MDYKKLLINLIEDLCYDVEIDTAQCKCNTLTQNGIGKKELEELGLSHIIDRLEEEGGEFNPYYNWDYDLDDPDPSGYTPYPHDLEYEDDEDEYGDYPEEMPPVDPED